MVQFTSFFTWNDEISHPIICRGASTMDRNDRIVAIPLPYSPPLYRPHPLKRWGYSKRGYGRMNAPLKNAVTSHRDSEDIVTPAE